MSRMRGILVLTLVLGLLTAAHVGLNQGGFGRFWAKLRRQEPPGRPELTVGHLPVT